MKKIFENINKIDLVFGLLVLAYFFYIFFKYTVNIPVNDDYDVIANFNDILDANSFSEKAKLFYLQHNEHRILYDKFWFYISYWFSDSGLNFNFLCFIGNLSLVALLAFYYFRLRKHYPNYFILFPLAVFLLNLALWENLTFAMASLSNFAFVVFAILSLHYLTKKEIANKDISLSILFLALSLLTQGGGVFVYPVALFALIIRQNKAVFFKYSIVGLLLVIGYFIDYKKYPSPGLAEIAGNAHLYFKFFLTFLGSAVANYHFFPDNSDAAIWRSFILGILFFAFYGYLLIKKYFRKNLFNFSVMTLVMVISAVTAINRLSQGMPTATASRYRLLSIVFIICIFIYVLELFKSRNYKMEYTNTILVLVSTSYLFFFSFNGKNESLMSYRKRAFMNGALSYFSNDHSLLSTTKPEFCAEVLKRSKESEAFVLNEKMINNYYTFAKAIDLKNVANESSIVDISQVVTIKKLKDSYYIDGYTSLQDLNTKNQQVYIVLSNNGSQKTFLAKNEFVPGLSVFFDTPNVDFGGFFARIKDEEINSGKNDILLIIENEGKSKVITTDKSLTK
jgi:hypothetical protein